MEPLYQLNFQTKFGGGEVYTHFLCEAFSSLKIRHLLLTHTKAPFWETLTFTYTPKVAIQPNIQTITGALPEPGIVITHGSVPTEWRKAIQTAGHKLIGIAHMPLYGRDANAFVGYDGVIGVSQYVINSLRDASVPNIYSTPWLGVASLNRNVTNTQIITETSCYDWDLRKGRDRILSWLEPLYEPVRKRQSFLKKQGLTLGIVSRLTPIKQFPLLFEHLAPALTDIPNLNIEIFGSGGYASVRDLKKSLDPIKDNVRFWGHQKNISLVYQNLDFLLTGLPEKEALGLNVIEAQQCNLPVLAVNALPFQETVTHKHTGYLFTDPRSDDGQHFKQLVLELLHTTEAYPQPHQHSEHLKRFSLTAFTQRVQDTLPWLTE